MTDQESFERQVEANFRWNFVVNLLDIVERAGKLPSINTLVDAYNLLSLKHAVVMGAYDRRARDALCLGRVADHAAVDVSKPQHREA